MTVCRTVCQFFVKRQLSQTRSAETVSMVIGLCGRFAKITFPLVENHHGANLGTRVLNNLA